MARRRGANQDPVGQVLGIARDRAAYVLEASPLLRYALEFFVAHALAAWSSLRQSRATLRAKAKKELVCSEGEETGGGATPPQLDAAAAEGARMGLPEAGRPPAPAGALCDSSHRDEGDQHEGMQLAISVANAKPARYRADLDRTCNGADTHAGEICTTRPPTTMPGGARTDAHEMHAGRLC